MGLKPSYSSYTFLCTADILPRFPQGPLVFPHQKHTGHASPHWGSASGLTSIWPPNLVVQPLYFFFCSLSFCCTCHYPALSPPLHLHVYSLPLLRHAASVLLKANRTTNADKIQSRLDQLTSTASRWNVWPFCNYLSLRHFARCFMVGWQRWETLVTVLTCPSVLQLTARSLPAVHSDERLQPLLTHLR